MVEKRLVRVGAVLEDLRAFPPSARRLAGYQLRRVQAGLMPSDWKPMKGIGPGVKEIRIRVRHTATNVYRDLGFSPEEAENLKARSDLMIQLTKIIEQRGLTQAAAARLLGVTQPRVSDLIRGKTDRFSIDSLVEMLGHAGVRVTFVLKPRRKVA